MVNHRPTRQFDHVNPEFLTNPLMWLPHHITQPYVSLHPDGRVRTVEAQELYIVRIMLELGAANMYDTDSGGWVDILALFGLDVDDEHDLDRVKSWLDGAHDPILDSIDLSSYFVNPVDTPQAREWALGVANELSIPLLGSSYNRVAEDCLTLIDAVADPTRYTSEEWGGDDITPRRTMLTNVLVGARVNLKDYPSETLDLPDGIESVSAAITSAIETIDAAEVESGEELIDRVVPTLDQLFCAIRDATAGDLTDLLTFIQAAEELHRDTVAEGPPSPEPSED
ncbi:MAG: hypothetical protein ACTIIH_13700 [Brevibacterium sp.]|uniref:hypothetical protein n=1 Tax=Brevibacterium TaxID=1696 RepID=UPI003F8C2512